MENKGTITKQKIISSAFSLFAAKGYDGATMADIMKDTGLSTGALYHHFKSKESIADTGIRDFADKLDVCFKEILEQDDTALEKLRTVMIRQKEIYGDQEQALMSILASSKISKLKEKMQLAHRGKFVMAMQAIIRQGQEEGTFKSKDSSEVIAHFVFGIDESFYKLPSEVLTNSKELKKYYISGMHLSASAMGIEETFFDEFID